MRNTRLLLALLSSGCMNGGADIHTLAQALKTGPRIAWELDARPLPVIPFPNDIATRPDGASPTGLRLNVSQDAETAHERRLRRLVNRLDGFGTFAPITLPLTEPLDVFGTHVAQTDTDITNDAVVLIDIDPSSPERGRRVALDVGPGPDDRGKTRFPLGLDEVSQYFLSDPRGHALNLLFETEDEDLIPNDKLDEGEDTDGDGVLDRPNTWTELLGARDDLERYLSALESDVLDRDQLRGLVDLVTFYEAESRTLIVRPKVPLRERTRYAVIVTQALHAVSGESFTSPFSGVNHTSQSGVLAPLFDGVGGGLLAAAGVAQETVQFVWSFTTQTITHELIEIREGLYGYGPLSGLSQEFPAQLSLVPKVEHTAANPYVLPIDRLVTGFRDSPLLTMLQMSAATIESLATSYEDNVSHLVFGQFDSPAFLDNEDGVLDVMAPARETISFVCTVPSQHRGRQPFPVVLYCHGTGSNRFEILGYAASLAAFGLATCAIDAYGHGLLDNEFVRAAVDSTLKPFGLDLLGQVAITGRARDLNDDGFSDSGGDFWTFNAMHTRDVVRQSVVDHQQFVRVLRGFGQGTMPVDVDSDGHLELAGDFDGNGVPDIGGDVAYSMMGQSLGGIVTALVGATDPKVDVVAPVVAGAGLIDLIVRSIQPGAVQSVWMPIMGPLITGRPVGNHILVSQDVLDVRFETEVQLALIPGIGGSGPDALALGDTVLAKNTDTGLSSTFQLTSAGALPAGSFRLQLAADAGDGLRITFTRRGATKPYREITTFERDTAFMGKAIAAGTSLRLLQQGFGMRRQSPDLRRFTGIAQMIVDPADPANFARYYAHPLDIRPEGRVPRSILSISSIGDMNVPINTGVMLAELAGLLTLGESVALRDSWTVEGLEKVRRLAVSPCHYTPEPVLFDASATSLGALHMQHDAPTFTEVVRHPDCAFLGACETACVPQGPVRPQVSWHGRVSGARFLFQDKTGTHSFKMPDPSLPFDHHRYQINQLGAYFKGRGARIEDDPKVLAP